jgi:hypothetical protein
MIYQLRHLAWKLIACVIPRKLWNWKQTKLLMRLNYVINPDVRNEEKKAWVRKI